MKSRGEMESRREMDSRGEMESKTEEMEARLRRWKARMRRWRATFDLMIWMIVLMMDCRTVLLKSNKSKIIPGGMPTLKKIIKYYDQCKLICLQQISNLRVEHTSIDPWTGDYIRISFDDNTFQTCKPNPDIYIYNRDVWTTSMTLNGSEFTYLPCF